MKHRRLIKMPASPSQISLREGMPVLRQRRRKAKRSMLGACSIRCHGISLREHAPALRTSGVSRRPDHGRILPGPDDLQTTVPDAGNGLGS